jgi:hypothetical protein
VELTSGAGSWTLVSDFIFHILTMRDKMYHWMNDQLNHYSSSSSAMLGWLIEQLGISHVFATSRLTAIRELCHGQNHHFEGQLNPRVQKTRKVQETRDERVSNTG